MIASVLESYNPHVNYDATGRWLDQFFFRLPLNPLIGLHLVDLHAQLLFLGTAAKYVTPISLGRASSALLFPVICVLLSYWFNGLFSSWKDCSTTRISGHKSKTWIFFFDWMDGSFGYLCLSAILHKQAVISPNVWTSPSLPFWACWPENALYQFGRKFLKK